MYNRFDLEQGIMTCWAVVDDIKALTNQYLNVGNMTEDQVANYLLGLETIYQVKFEQLQAIFERMVQDRQIDDRQPVGQGPLLVRLAVEAGTKFPSETSVSPQEAKFASLVMRECVDWINQNVGLVDQEAQQDLARHLGLDSQ